MDVRKGTVEAYDPKTMTAKVVASNGSECYQHCSVIMASMDYSSGSYKFEPPVPGSPCIYITDGTSAFILGYYLPDNFGDDSQNVVDPNFVVEDCIDPNPGIASNTGAVYSKSPSNFPNKSSLPGDSIQRGASGSEVGMKDNMYKISLGPLLQSIWNGITNLYSLACTNFKLTSPGLEINSAVASNQDCTTDITLRSNTSETKSGKPAVLISIGKKANLVTVSINGKQIFKVDGDQNMTLQGNRLILDFKNVDATPCSAINFPL